MESSTGHLLLLGGCQMFSGAAAMAGFVVLLVYVVRLAYSWFQGRPFLPVIRARLFLFAASAYTFAAVGSLVTFLVDSRPREQVGAPAVWVLLAAICAGFWWRWRRRSTAQTTVVESPKPTSTSHS